MSTVLSKHIVCVITAFALLLGIVNISVNAENYSDGHIIIDTVSAVTGDTVIVKLNMENNPGIMAMTISITYDSSALSYQKFYRGYLRDYMVVDHPDKNLIRLVNCESINFRDNDTMISLEFKVKDNAEFGFYPISVEYKSGDFCNFNLKKFMPKITSGGVDIAFNGNNCSHKKYDEWQTVAKPSCENPGAEQRNCIKCGHADIKEIPAVGHDYEDLWTIDKPATAESSGIMSRHCKNCDSSTDTLTFSLEQSEEEKLQNNSGSVVNKSEFTDKLVKEQLPEKSDEKPNEKTDENGKENSGEDIFTEIVEGEDGPIEKITSAVPDLPKFMKIFFAAVVVLLSLLLI